MLHADADAACGCVKRHAFCLIPCVRNAVRFICIFRRRLVCNGAELARVAATGRCSIKCFVIDCE